MHGESPPSVTSSIPASTEAKVMKPTKVLHIYSGNLFGGIESGLITIARHQFQQSSIEHHFALCHTGRLSEELGALGAPIYILGATRVRYPWSVLSVRRGLRQLFQSQQFHAVVSHSAWLQVIFGPEVRRSRIPTVFWLHDAAEGKGWLDRWAGRSRPHFVICNSRFTESTLPKLYPNIHHRCLLLPASAPAKPRSSSDRTEMRTRLGVSEDQVVIVQVSRMEGWKGHLLHLSALSHLTDVPNWTCWMVGGPQREKEVHYLAELKTRAGQLGIADRVRFLGQRSDVRELLSAADIHCQPNTGPEPFGQTFIEGLYAGLPVVTTAMGGALEIVTPECGCLVPPDDPLALASTLRELIENKQARQKLGRNGPARATALCHPETQLAKLDMVLSAVARRDWSGAVDEAYQRC